MIELNKKNIKRIIGILTFAILLFWGMQNLTVVGNAASFVASLLLPFIIGICIAFVLNVPINFIEKKIWKAKGKLSQKKRSIRRIVSISISFILLIAVLGFVIFLVVPELFTAFHVLQQNLPNVMQTFQGWLEEITRNYPELSQNIQSMQIDWDMLGNHTWKFVQSGFLTVVQSSINFVMGTITVIVNITIGIIFAIYLLTQKEKLLHQLRKIVYAYCNKEKADKTMHIATVSNKTFHDFVGGQLLEACILGLLCFIGMMILQIPYAAAISILVGLTALIPLVGAFIGTAVGVILIVVSSPIKALVFVIFILVLQQIEGNLIYPRVVGKSVGLPPIWVLVAITIGGSLLGLVGMIISVPISSIVYVLLRENVNKRLQEKQIKIK